MAATKTARTLQSSTSNGAGATTTSAAWNLSTAYGGVVQARVTNGTTGPTVPCSMTVNLSVDGSTWRQAAVYAAGTTANASYDFAVEIPPAAMYAEVVFSGNTAQAVTVEAYGHELTTV
jgi:hypothetical protein